jgi:putative ABC transport system permease protein
MMGIRFIIAEAIHRPGRIISGIVAMMVSVCLIIWLMGSYNTLISGFGNEADAYMGEYDFCVVPMQRGGMPGSGPQKGGDGQGMGFGFLGNSLKGSSAIKSQQVGQSKGERPSRGAGDVPVRGMGRPNLTGGARPPMSQMPQDGGKSERPSGGAFSSLVTGDASLPKDLVEELLKEPTVEFVHQALQVRIPMGKLSTDTSTLDDEIRKRMGTPSMGPMLVASDASHCPFHLEDGDWPDMSQSHALQGVLGSASAKTLGVKVGDSVELRAGARITHVKIVGIIKQSRDNGGVGGGGGPALATLTVPYQIYQQITGAPWSPNLLSLKLKEGVDKKAFREHWQVRLAQSGVGFADTESVSQGMKRDRTVQAMKASANSGIGLVLFSCIFIIFTTLSMGVRERSRRLALMRAIGISKRQVVAIVFGESLLLSFPAVIGGLLAGWILVAVLGDAGWIESFPTWTTIAVACVCAAGGGLLASILPAWKATRIDPVEVRSDAFESKLTNSGRTWWILGVIGLLAWSIQPLALLIPDLPESVVRPIFILGGYPGLIIGVLCLAPACAVASERILGPWVARLLGLHPSLLKMQLTGHLAQSAGTAVSMTVGLGLFMAIQIWGYSMLVPFTPDQSMPNTLISFLHTDWASDDCASVIQKVGQSPDKLHPIYVEEPDINAQQLASPQFAGNRQKSVVIAGLPLAKMFGGPEACLNLQFVQGNLKEALQMMSQEPAILVPDTFANTVHMNVGDILKLDNPSVPGETQNWKIAGVVSMPGWHWLTKTSGIRVRNGGFIAAFVLADAQQVKSHFKLDRIRFFWGNVIEGTDQTALQKNLEGLLADTSSHAESTQERGVELRPMVKVTSRQSLTESVGHRADSVLTAMSRLPIIALIIAGLAVMNTIMASVRTRRHAIGVMRAVGVTRSQVVRLIWAEGILLGLAAVILSFCLALLVSWGALEIQRYGYLFGAIVPEISIPWTHLAVGTALTLILCWLAGTAVAAGLSRHQVTELLMDTPE